MESVKHLTVLFVFILNNLICVICTNIKMLRVKDMQKESICRIAQMHAALHLDLPIALMRLHSHGAMRAP